MLPGPPAALETRREGGWRVRAARPGDERAIAALIRESLPACVLPLTIWDSPRIAHYVRALLAGALPEQRHRFYLLERRGAIEGVAAFRLEEGCPFLNHIAAREAARGRGLGALLLAGSLRDYLCGLTPAQAADRVALDVFADNAAAGSWYRRLGFIEANPAGSARRVWRIEELRSSGGGPPALAAFTPAFARAAFAAVAWWCAPGGPLRFRGRAGRSLREWGFCSVQIRTPGGACYEAGILPGPYFRVAGSAAACDAALHAALRRIDPVRRLLLIAPDGPAAGTQPVRWRQVACSVRLECCAGKLLSNLASRPQPDLHC